MSALPNNKNGSQHKLKFSTGETKLMDTFRNTCAQNNFFLSEKATWTVRTYDHCMGFYTRTVETQNVWRETVKA